MRGTQMRGIHKTDLGSLGICFKSNRTIFNSTGSGVFGKDFFRTSPPHYNKRLTDNYLEGCGTTKFSPGELIEWLD